MSREVDPTAARRGGTLVLFALILVGALGIFRWRLVHLGGKFREARETAAAAVTTARVKAALMSSSRVSAFDIEIDTEGAVVTLKGQVPANEIRGLAAAIAEDVASPMEVRNELAVVPGVRPDSELEELRRRLGELKIETSVLAALAKHPGHGKKDIRVGVTGERDTLRGSVDDREDKLGAKRLALATEGVGAVVSDLVVHESKELVDGRDGDERLARRLESALFASEVFDVENMEIGVDAGRVTLAGMVRSRAEALLAERIVRDVDDVREVTNALEVAADPVMSDAGRR
ncbi:MAG TPA: BON domain-containing protein [Vicinamibacteria bacterium]|nr:BON domain-containing protein [Vicinamibacteria bacterium]